MKKIVLLIFSIIATFNLVAENQRSYLETKLSPCTEECFIFNNMPNLNMTDILFAELETCMDDFSKCYIGTGTYHNRKVFWKKSGNTISIDSTLRTFESTNTRYDTIKTVLNYNSLEVILDSSSNEIKYIWLNPLVKGELFPDLTLEQLDGEKISTKDFTNKIIVINWWQTTCGPCRAEIPGFNKLVEQYKDNPNVIFLAIADESKYRVKHYLSTHEFEYLQTVTSIEARRLFKGSYPKNIVINTSGIISYSSSGGHENMYRDIEKAINKFNYFVSWN
jgi:thiol-disulfide isomerase/thioredoxin